PFALRSSGRDSRAWRPKDSVTAGEHLAEVRHRRRVRGKAAVGEQRLAGDERGLIGSQKHGRIGDVPGQAEIWREVMAFYLVAQRCRHVLFPPFGEDEAYNTHIGADALLAVLRRHILRQVEHRRLRSTVRGLTEIALRALARG